MLTTYINQEWGDGNPENYDLNVDISGVAMFTLRAWDNLRCRFLVDDTYLHVDVYYDDDPEAYEHWIWTDDLEDDGERHSAVCAAVGSAIIMEMDAGACLHECFADYGLWEADS